MNNLCGRFYFAKDMNGDFVFTISDVWLMIKFIWLLPVKAVLALIETNPKWVTFFEIDCSTGESWGGGILAFFGWIAILTLIVVLLAELGNRAGGNS